MDFKNKRYEFVKFNLWIILCGTKKKKKHEPRGDLYDNAISALSALNVAKSTLKRLERTINKMKEVDNTYKGSFFRNSGYALSGIKQMALMGPTLLNSLFSGNYAIAIETSGATIQMLADSIEQYNQTGAIEKSDKKNLLSEIEMAILEIDKVIPALEKQRDDNYQICVIL